MESIKAKGLSVFKDNAKGSVTFVAWRRKTITHAEGWGGETAKQVMLGELAGVPPDENKEKCNRMYVDLIYNLDKRIYSDDRYTSQEAAQANAHVDEGVQAVRTGDITAAGKKRLDAIIKKLCTKYFNLLNTLTCTDDDDEDSNANDIVMLHEHDSETNRLKQIWKELADTYDDYPDYVIMELKHQLDSLQVFKIKGTETKEGTCEYRTWNQNDSMEETLTAIEKLRKKYIRIMKSVKPKEGCPSPEEDADPAQHDRAQYKTIIAKFSEMIESHGYEVTLSEYKTKHPGAGDWESFKSTLKAKSKKMERKKINSGPGTNSGHIHLNHDQGSYTDSRKETDCRFWVKFGNCKFGDSCAFKHDPNKKGNGHVHDHGTHDHATEYDQHGNEICRKYKFTGKCRFGDKCRFAHVNTQGKTVNNPKKNNKRKGEHGGDTANKKKTKWNKSRAEEYAKAEVTKEREKLIAAFAAKNPTADLSGQFPLYMIPASRGAADKLWDEGRNIGWDSDACMSLTMYSKFIVNMRECEPIELTGLGGKKIIVKQKGTWILQFKTATGKTVVLCTDVYYHPDCGTNVVSAISLSENRGYSLKMDHAADSGMKSSTNSDHAIKVPDGEVIWCTKIGDTKHSILGVRALKRVPDMKNLPTALVSNAKKKITVYVHSQKEMRLQRDAMQLAAAAIGACQGKSTVVTEEQRVLGDAMDWEPTGDTEVTGENFHQAGGH